MDNIRVLLHSSQMHSNIRKKKPPRFDYPATSVGKTTHFQVWYATSLRQAGHDIATAVLGRVEADYQTLAKYFGLQLTGFNIIVAPLSPNMDGSGGAYHHSCIAADLYCDVQIHPAVNPNITNAFVIAEETEVFMAAQHKGWDCGGSNGEGLSRVLAETLYPGVLNDYETASVWLDGQRPNFHYAHRSHRSKRRIHRLCGAVPELAALTVELLVGANMPGGGPDAGSSLCQSERQT